MKTKFIEVMTIANAVKFYGSQHEAARQMKMNRGTLITKLKNFPDDYLVKVIRSKDGFSIGRLEPINKGVIYDTQARRAN